MKRSDRNITVVISCLLQHCYGDRLYVDDAVQSLGLATVKPRKHMPRTRTDR